MEKPILSISKQGVTVGDFSIDLDKESLLGRSQDCAIKLDDRAVSREHAVIRPIEAGKGIQIQSRSAFAPLTINGTEVTSAILKQGDIVQVGPYLIQVKVPTALGAGASRASNTALIQASVDEPTLLSDSLFDQDPAPNLSVQSPAAGELAGSLELNAKGEISNSLSLNSKKSSLLLETQIPTVEPKGQIAIPVAESEPIDAIPLGGTEMDGFALAELSAFGTATAQSSSNQSLGTPSANANASADGPSVAMQQGGVDLTNMFQEPTGSIVLPQLDGADSQPQNPFAEQISAIQEVSLTGSDGQKRSFNTQLEATVPSEADVAVAGGEPLLQMETGTSPQPAAALKLNLDDTSAREKPAATGLQQTSASVGGSAVVLPPMDPSAGFSAVSSATQPSLKSKGGKQASTDATLAITGAVEANLLIPPGKANVANVTIGDGEVFLGRGKSCQVILNDPKSSGKHAKIFRVGSNFVLEDLGSSNGTYHNGNEVKGQVSLAGEDKIRIGDTEMTFRAVSAEFEAQQADFLNIPTQDMNIGSLPPIGAGDPLATTARISSPLSPGNTGSMIGVEAVGVNYPPAYPPAAMPPGIFGQGQAPTAGEAAGLDGIEGLGGKKKKSIMKWILYAAGFLFIIDPGIFLGTPTKKKVTKKTPTTQTEKKDQQQITPANKQDMPKVASASYDSLPEAEKRKIDAMMDNAARLNREKAYEEARFELQRILGILPDYKAAQELLTYVEEDLSAKRKEEERRREEERLKTLQAEVEAFVKQATEVMAQKNYSDAEKLFDKILELDPENQDVPRWREEIQLYKEKLAEEAERKRLADQLNQEANAILRQGTALGEKGKWIAGINRLRDVAKVNAPNKQINARAREKIAEFEGQLAAIYNPLIEEAKLMEENGSIEQAYAKFAEATRVDSRRSEGYQGMSRIRGILEEKAKITYTEAVINESFSDFEAALKKFNETMKIAPTDSVYYQRAKRKVSRFSKLGIGTPLAGQDRQESADVGPSVELE